MPLVSRRAAVCSFAAAACLCAPLLLASTKIDVRFDKKANFSNVGTFAWIDVPVAAAADAKALDKGIRTGVEFELEVKGYRRAIDERPADLRLTYYVLAKTVDEPMTLGDALGYTPGWPADAPPAPGAKPLVIGPLQPGTLVVDIVRALDKIAIWRGIANAAVNPSGSADRRVRAAEDAVKKMFEKFPPSH